MRTLHCFAAVVTLVVAMAWPGWSQLAAPPPVAPTLSSADSLVKIDLLSRKIAAANPQYPDVKKVPDGALIWVPTGQGAMIQYKLEPWGRSDKGCFWDLAAYHLYSVRPTSPVAAPVAVPAPVQPSVLEKFLNALQVFLNIFGWLLFLLLVLVVAYLLYRRRERQLDPRRDPPMVRGGISQNPQEAMEQIQAATRIHHGGNRQVVSVQRGRLHNAAGQQRTFITRVEFGDGKVRRKRLEEGMICWQVVVSEPNQAGQAEQHTEFWLNHCGNRVAERKDGKFDLPNGWEFVPEPAVAAHIPEEAEQVAAAVAQGVVDRAIQQVETNGREYKVTLEVKNGQPTPTVYTVKSEGGRFIKGFEVTKAGTLRVDL